eukprot:bmy_13184T0
MILGLLASLVNGACLPVMSLILGEMSDSLISGCLVKTNKTNYRNCTQSQEKVNEDMIVLILYYVGIGVTAMVFGYIQISFWVMTAARQTTRIRKQFFHSILSQDISWFDSCDIGELNTRMTDDINKINDDIGDKIALLFQNMSTFSVGLAIGLVKGWKLTLVTLSTSPLIIASAAMFSRVGKMTNVVLTGSRNEGILTTFLSSSYLATMRFAGAVAEEVLSSIRTVTAFGAQEKEVQRYTQNLKDAKNVGMKKAIASKLSLGAVYFFMNGTYGLAFWYGTSLILSGEPDYTIGTVLAVFFSVIHSSYCIGAAAPSFETFTIARGAAFNIFHIIDKLSIKTIYQRDQSERIQGDIPMFGENILKGLNLRIKSGETVALVGPNCSGKSTAVQLLQRLYDPDDGFVLLIPNYQKKSIGIIHAVNILSKYSQSLFPEITCFSAYVLEQ